MKQIKIYSYAKINLSLDVKNKRHDGYHEVDMIMQSLDFHDDVTVSYRKISEAVTKASECGYSDAANVSQQNKSNTSDIRTPLESDRNASNHGITISLKTNKSFLPTDERNIAYKAAQLIVDKFVNENACGEISIDIKKRIPVAAGLAGGSGNAAAVLLGLSEILDLNLDLKGLCDLGQRLGADVPFCILGQAKENPSLSNSSISKDPLIATCARATGIGTDITKVPSTKAVVVIAKPNLSVSTKEVYEGIDDCNIVQRPDNDKLTGDLTKGNLNAATDEMVNVLECYTLEKYIKVKELKNLMAQCKDSIKVMMSGSGPTVFALFHKYKSAKDMCSKLREQGYEAYWTITI